MDLFDFVKMIFQNSEKALSLSRYEKNKHSYMINRLCSIRFPFQAALLSNMNVHGSTLVDFWICFLKKIYHDKIPDWFFTKPEKSIIKKDNWYLTKDEYEYLTEYFECTNKDIDSYIKYGEIEELKEILKKK